MYPEWYQACYTTFRNGQLVTKAEGAQGSQFEPNSGNPNITGGGASLRRRWEPLSLILRLSDLVSWDSSLLLSYPFSELTPVPRQVNFVHCVCHFLGGVAVSCFISESWEYYKMW
jgi:hypothetical protein